VTLTARATGVRAVRDAWLDGLRAFAALMVFVHHATPGVEVGGWYFGGGWDAGVLVFFSLSGYLLYRPFLEGPVDLRTYAIRRLLRIFPAYLVAAAGIAVLHGLPFDPVGVLTMTRTPIIVAWTLQIEVVFYAALPLIAFGTRARIDALLALAVASLVVATASAVSTKLMPLDFLSWAWAFVPGMLVAHVAVRMPERLAIAGRPLVLAGGLALLAVSIVPNIIFPDLPAAVGSALVLAWLLTRSAPGPTLTRLFVAGGAVSYSLYLWHEALMTWDRPPSLPGALAALLLSLTVAGVSYVLIERPAIQLGRRITGRLRYVARTA
jgi:peptidoglycan/LPS O-acetylase OafA/YrhL